MGGSKKRIATQLLTTIGVTLGVVALLAIFLRRASDKSHKNDTDALIAALDKACRSYQRDFGVFPRGSGTDSRPLHRALGSRRPSKFPPGFFPPYFEFKPNHLRLPVGKLDFSPTPPVMVIDSYGNDIRYRNEPSNGTPDWNSQRIEIWSPGKDGIDDLPGQANSDDIRNRW